MVVSHCAKDLKMMEFDKCAKESFINQYIKGSVREGATPNLLLGNTLRQVTEVTVGRSDHNSIRFKVITEKDMTDPC